MARATKVTDRSGRPKGWQIADNITLVDQLIRLPELTAKGWHAIKPAKGGRTEQTLPSPRNASRPRRLGVAPPELCGLRFSVMFPTKPRGQAGQVRDPDRLRSLRSR